MIIGFHGTVFQINEWSLPAGALRSSRGPTAICFSPTLDVAKQYMSSMSGTEELARLWAAQEALYFDFDAIDRKERLATSQAKLKAAREAWAAAGYPRHNKVYRSSIAPARPRIFDAKGNKHYNMTNELTEKHRGKVTIWGLGIEARDTGHDCLIVENVIDGGTDDASAHVAATTIMVFDPTILSAPELVFENVSFQKKA